MRWQTEDQVNMYNSSLRHHPPPPSQYLIMTRKVRWAKCMIRLGSEHVGEWTRKWWQESQVQKKESECVSKHWINTCTVCTTVCTVINKVHAAVNKPFSFNSLRILAISSAFSLILAQKQYQYLYESLQFADWKSMFNNNNFSWHECKYFIFSIFNKCSINIQGDFCNLVLITLKVKWTVRVSRQHPAINMSYCNAPVKVKPQPP